MKQCERCQADMVAEFPLHTDGDGWSPVTVAKPGTTYHCIMCGYYTDSVIESNRNARRLGLHDPGEISKQELKRLQGLFKEVV